MHGRVTTTMAAGLLLLSGAVGAQEAPEIRIETVNGTEREERMAEELRALLETYDLEPWILTRVVRIEQGVIPRSHPVLTLHTRHLGDEIGLLSTFVHEQLHWLEEEPWLGSFRAAMEDFEALYPEVPSSEEGGARDDESTYRHLLVCDMELQAVAALVGEETAREVLGGITHYEWIYEKVLNDSRVREVALRHGFDVTGGVPKR